MKALWLIAAPPGLVCLFWIANLAAGTVWAVLVAAPAIVCLFTVDLWSEVRSGRAPTSLQRFEAREERRQERRAA